MNSALDCRISGWLRLVIALSSAAAVSPGWAATFTVTTTANSGAGSLHQAILDANAAAGADVIAFNIATASKTITPPSTAALPTITEALTIDGTTQPGFAGVPLIELNGASGPAASDGLKITASDCMIRGLVINRWKGDGIEIQGGANNVVEGCFIGVSLNGASDQGNTLSGVFLSGSANNRIGGTTAAQRNVISGNEDHGVRVEGAASTGNVIQGNYLGLNAAGAAVIRNSDHGVSVEGAGTTTIGGPAEGAGNVISGNGARGVSLTGGATGTVIQGNVIGLNAVGEADLGNTQDGIHVAGADDTQIGGPSAAARNVISGNNGDGIELNGATTTDTLIQGNYLGLRSSGAASVVNSTHGLFINGAVNTTVGGSAAGAGNVISGSGQHGVAVAGATTAGVVVQGNVIGLDAGGTLDLGNSQDGLNVNGVAGVTVGGAAAGAGNVIAGNNGDGVELTGAATQNAVLEGNTIGREGAPNAGAGLLIASAATKNRVGGVAAGQANTVAFNTGDGVFISGGPENSVRGNSIHSNGGLGIDLGGNGIQSNDATDADSGANLLQNYPVLTEAVLRAAATEVNGTLQSTANATFTLDFHGNDAADPAGNGEGQTWLGSAEVTTDATGFASFTVNVAPTAQRFLSATATDAAGNTSEFSATRRAVTTATPANFAVTTTDDSGPGSLRQAILDANAALNEGDRITFNLPGDGPHTIAPVTALPALAAPVTLDGYTQPGATPNTLADGFNATLRIILDGNAAPTATDGLRLEAPRVTVRGLVLNRWKGEGIEILATSGVNVLEGNVIGLGLDSADLGQNSHGVLVTGSSGNRFGGPAPAQRNVISGNGNHGIFLNGAGARDNVIQGNFLGTDLTGTARVVNNGDGVHVTAGSGNRIGGGAGGEGNVIGGNNGEGVELENANANVVQGNRLGVAFNGAEIRNGGNGVLLNNASDTVIGGAAAGAGNVIARNSGRGLTLLNNTSQRNQFRANSIFANGNLGIDLFNNGRTLNDAGDADPGPNGFQNFPELIGAVAAADSTRVKGTLHGTANTAFTLDFFASREGDSTGFGEGEQFLGSLEVTTGADGNAAFDGTLPARVVGRVITATATGPEGTSEFSATVRATATIPPLTFTVTTAADSGPGSLRQALLDADPVVTGPPHRIVFAIPGDGPHTIALATPLPVLVNEPVELDGFTQPGASANTLAEGFNASHRVVLDGTALPFNSVGLRFNTSGNVVRGLVLVNFRSNEAVLIEGNDNAVEGCRIGLGLDGTAQPNFYGVRITGSATGNRVGGPAPAARNVIAGSGNVNVRLESTAGGNRVQGNLIGLLPAGNAAPANSDTFFGTGTGILIQGSPDNLIGGAEPGAGNVIGGHSGVGVEIRDAAAVRSRILGNRIGTDVTGQLPVPNGDGIWIVGGPGTVVGGVGAGEGNRIAFNRQHGVNVNGFANENDNPIRGNSITANLQLGINLGFDGVLENDGGDADANANRGQNFPVLTAATAGNGSTTVQGTLNSVASRAYTLDFYANVACDSSGNGEGDQFLGSATVTTGADGNGTFNVTFPVTVVGRFLTATATDPDGNTSEFGDCFEAATQFGSETFLVTNTNDSGDGSLRDALLKNNASVAGSANRIEFNVPGDGPHVFTPASSLPAVTHAVVIDGYSQPGARANTLADGSDAVLKIHLRPDAVFGGTGLQLNGSGSLVRGLALTKFFNAIVVNGGQNTIQGCFIGLDPAGSAEANPGNVGLNVVSGNGHRVGGSAPGERNLIGGNNTGLVLAGNDAVIEGNWFGLDPSGRLPRGNRQPIQLSGNNHRFGGSEQGARNVVAATAADGVRLTSASNCLVAGNFIGTDATGLGELGNQGVGLVVTGESAGNQILGNVIGGSSGAAIQSFGGSVILGNRIGVGVDATTPLPNGFGVFLNGSGNRLGGVAPGEANVIANNRGDGVLLTGEGAVENPVRGNVITGNTGLGLNLGFDGVTPNDAGDADTGPNALQNFPELTAATVHESTVDLAGTLDSTPNAAFTLDFYANREADASGFGEGRQYLGSTTVNTGADGRATFNVTFNVVALGRWLTATATDAAGSTSEFSRALRAATTRPGQTFTVTSAADSGPGTLRQAILDASAVMAGMPHLIRFDIPAPAAPSLGRHAALPPGVRTVALQSPLPVPEEPVTIDGFTQPGTAANAAEDRDDALRLIHLHGSGLPFGTAGLSLRLAGSSVRGLIITDVNGPGVELLGEGGHLVAGCLLAGNQHGVLIRGSSGNRIGGALRGERNVIVESEAAGVLITGENPKESLVLGNFIGLDAGGETAALNADGIRVESGSGHRIGGLAPGEANWIAFNRLSGVYLLNGQGIVVRGNRLFANGGLGLNLGNLGVTANDPGDADVGANGLQNFPVLTVANVVSGGVRVVGTLNSAPGTAYDLDFYHNAACDGLGNGEGARHLGSLTVTTDAAGNSAFDEVLPAAAPRGVVTATATGPDGTSEFSQCRELGTELPAATFLVTTTADSGPGSLRQAILDANVAFTSARNTIAFNLPGTGVQMIQPLTPLPDITQAVDVDGYTQPGAAPAPLAENLNHRILVRLDGEQAGANADGLTVAGSGISVRGLMVTRFAGRGLRVKPGGDASLRESWVGTAGNEMARSGSRITRQAAFFNPEVAVNGNGGGVFSDQGQLTIINSVVSGNASDGVGNTGGTVDVDGSLIGPAPGGDTLLGNGGDGVDSLRGAITIINSTVSGNDAFGVSVDDSGLSAGGPRVRVFTGNYISDNGAGAGDGGGISVRGNGPATVVPVSTLSDNTIENNDGPGADLLNTGGLVVTGNHIAGQSGPGIRLVVVTDTVIGANPTNPSPDDMNVIKGNHSGGVVAVDVFGVPMFFNIYGLNNLPVSTAPFAPTVPGVTYDSATGQLTVQSTVPVVPPQPPGEATLVVYVPVPNEPGCVQPGPTVTTQPDANGQVLFKDFFVNGVAVAVGDVNGDSSTAVLINPEQRGVDVAVTKDGPAQVSVDELAEFRVRAVANQRRAGGFKVVLRDVIPSGFKYVGFRAVWPGTAPMGYEPTVVEIPGGPGNPATIEISGFAGFDSLVNANDRFGEVDVTIRLRAVTPGKFINTASLLRTEGFTDTDNENNIGSVPVTVIARPPEPFDYGDAPASYGTLLINDGARHKDLGLSVVLGSAWDTELDGAPGANADGDGADEDGVTLPAKLVPGTTATIIIRLGHQANAAAVGDVVGWIDFNGNGTFDSQEQVIAKEVNASTVVEVQVPPGASLGRTYARFRVGGSTGLGPTGEALSGEVEDYAVEIVSGAVPVDLGLIIEGLPTVNPVPVNQPFPFTVQIANGGPIGEPGTVQVKLPAGLEVVNQPAACEPLSPNAQWLVTAHEFLFGRTPTEGQLTDGLEEIALTQGRTATATRLLNSAEHRSRDVQQAYRALLGREPSAGEVTAALEFLAQGTGLPGLAKAILRDVVFPDGGELAVQQVVEHARSFLSGLPSPDLFAQLGLEFDLASYLERSISDDLVRTWVPGLPIEELVNLAPRSVLYECHLPELASGASSPLTFQVNPLHPGVFVIEAEVVGEQPDPNPANDREQGQVLVAGPQDFGDAPALGMNPALFPPILATYPVLATDNGARHQVNPDVGLGNLTDTEADGQPHIYGWGDDGLAAAADDEDGVQFLSPPVVVFPGIGGPTPFPAVVAPALGQAGAEVKVDVQVRAPAFGVLRLNAWVDFNRDGDWADPREQVIANKVVLPGVTQFQFTVPNDVESGLSFARFRLSSAETLDSTGPAPDGEVEDHLVLLGPLERGDAPAVYGAAPHLFPPNPVNFLGVKIDPDAVQPSVDARADDTDADGDDEDGVTEIGPFFAGVTSSLVITASEDGFVDLWLDYNGVNGFEANPAAPDPTEYVNASIVGLPAGAAPAPFPVVKGANPIRFRVPDRLKSGLSFLRVRYTPVAIPALGPVSLAPTGEVEDYRVQLYPLAPDFGDAPDALTTPRYPTLRANNGAFHLVTEDRFFLGQRVDIEPDGFPSLNALGDDQDNGLENPADPEPDDEDGVRFLTPLTPGQSASVELVVTAQNPGPAFVNAWVDFNGDFDWADPGEQVLLNSPVSNGTNVVTIAVPAAARPGATYARFRLARDQGLGFAGPATSGEVEDYPVTIAEPAGELRIGAIVQVGDEVELRWEGGAGVRLESAPTVTGPWTPVAGATSPFRVNPGTPGAADGQFYRLAQ